MQEAFLENDIWDELIADWIEHKALRDRPTESPLPFSTRAVLRGLGYGLSPEEGDKRIVATKADEMRATRCLKRLGYVRDRHPRLAQGHRERFWRAKKHEISSV